MRNRVSKRVYNDAETIANLMNATGADYREAEQGLAIGRNKALERGLVDAEYAAFAYRVAYNALTDDGRKRKRIQRREVSIHNEAFDGHTYADTIEDRSEEMRRAHTERRERMYDLLRESGERVLELAQMCLDIEDGLSMKLKDPDESVSENEVRGLLREQWHKLYPYANSRDYYSDCLLVKKCLVSLSVR